MKKLKQYEVLKRASLFLQKNNCEIQVAEILLQHYLQLSRAQFYANMQEPIDSRVLHKFYQAIKKHAKTQIPVQHITGYEYFYGRKFYVNEHVLIPRPETEQLVETVLQYIQQHEQQRQLTIVDLGTGSGVIAITLALELESANIYATDISERALHMARKNAKKHKAKVQFFHGNFAQPLIEQKIRANMVISNPPYIAFDERPLLSPTVKHDPERALFAKNNGLAAYEKIIAR